MSSDQVGCCAVQLVGQASAIGVYPDGCPVCRENGTVEALRVHYETPGAYRPETSHGVGIWSNWGQFLPAVPASKQLTLGEGNTPLLQVKALAELTGCRNLYLKMEAQNPSGAHKDRFHAVNVAMAAALGMRGVVARSTGNHGLSMTAYCAAHGCDRSSWRMSRCRFCCSGRSVLPVGCRCFHRLMSPMRLCGRWSIQAIGCRRQPPGRCRPRTLTALRDTKRSPMRSIAISAIAGPIDCLSPPPAAICSPASGSVSTICNGLDVS